MGRRGGIDVESLGPEPGSSQNAPGRRVNTVGSDNTARSRLAGKRKDINVAYLKAPGAFEVLDFKAAYVYQIDCKSTCRPQIGVMEMMP